MASMARGPPTVQGIELIPTHRLPDRLRSVFKFSVFNAVQSKCFDTVYGTDDNVVVSAPTGSGKTVLLELAVCRLFTKQHNYKIVYQAPTKSLCAERQKDWQAKFSHLGLKCAELTGDTEHGQLRFVQTADILITTPEKWDSVTRKWKDHRKLTELVKLFLIDEVHILKEDRGASLEAVVSRMKSVGADVRFIALSATIPNSEDIASWLGKNNRVPGMPAAREVFGEEFRPVTLQKHVCGLQGNGGNEFAFEQTCSNKLPEVISTHTLVGKPIMIFCSTRKSTETTAKLLCDWWSSSTLSSRLWSAPQCRIDTRNEPLQRCLRCGIAFHHAGVDLQDRTTVEKAYLEGNVKVMCCTSTLAVGVNLPCHFVIIKNTVTYQTEGCKEYSDLEIMQMLGRAGRPQFDSHAVAVVITRSEKVRHYEKMVSGQETLESTLHLNLVEHLNAEICLGNIRDLDSAKTWLESTFFNIRLRRNPNHYRTHGKTVEQICSKELSSLREYSLISSGPSFKSTEFGETMTRYYVQFNSMKLLLGLQTKATISEILSAIAQASEFASLRFRSSEKQMYREINATQNIKFPIPVDLTLPAHKVSLIIQANLGGVDVRNDDKISGPKQQFSMDTFFVFQHVQRLIRCAIDCFHRQADSVAVRNALELGRSLSSKAWDDSPLQMLQIDQIGPVAIRKLVGAGIKTIEELDNADAQRIEMILSKNPPFGADILRNVNAFPKLRISLKSIGKPTIKNADTKKFVHVSVRAEIGFLNPGVPSCFKKLGVYVTVLAEISDGQLVHFSRLNGQALANGREIVFHADLNDPQQLINCYVSCDDLAGTMRHATLQPEAPKPMFWAVNNIYDLEKPIKRTLKRKSTGESEDEFGNGEIEDADLVAAADLEFDDIDEIGSSPPHYRVTKRDNQAQRLSNSGWNPRKLPNGKWSCNHKCKDKDVCRHLCCRDGLDNPPKGPRKSSGKDEKTIGQNQKPTPVNEFFKQSKLQNTSEHRSPEKMLPNVSVKRNCTKTYDPEPGSNRSYSDSSGVNFGDHNEALPTQQEIPLRYMIEDIKSVGPFDASFSSLPNPSLATVESTSSTQNTSRRQIRDVDAFEDSIEIYDDELRSETPSTNAKETHSVQAGTLSQAHLGHVAQNFGVVSLFAGNDAGAIPEEETTSIGTGTAKDLSTRLEGVGSWLKEQFGDLVEFV